MLLGAFVWLWDAFAPESLSKAYGRGIANPRSRPIVLGATVYVLMHLIAKKPAKLLIRW